MRREGKREGGERESEFCAMGRNRKVERMYVEVPLSAYVSVLEKEPSKLEKEIELNCVCMSICVCLCT